MKKLITFFSFLILTSTVFANSVGGSIGGWQVVSNVAQGVGAKITATKEVVINGVSKTLSSTANITPNPSNVAKFMAKAGGLVLADLALKQLFDGVDFVLDPANNTVQKQIKGEYKNAAGQTGSTGQVGSSLCNYLITMSLNGIVTVKDCKIIGTSTNGGRPCLSWTAIVNGAQRSACPVNGWSTVVQEDKVTIPISTVAADLVSQAEKDIKAGNPASPAVALSRAAAQDMIQEAEAENDNVKPNPIVTELQKNQAYPTTEDAIGTIDTPAVVDPVTGEIVKPAETSNVDIKIPKACEWFPQACLFFEWMQKEPELDEVDLPKEEKAKKEINEGLISISSNSCPAPYPVSIELPVLKTVYTDSIDISPYCSEIEKLAPVLQLLAFVLAVFIIKDI